MGIKHGLDECVILNGGTLEVSRRSMADTVEAILGAVEMDGGPEALLQVATRLGLVHRSVILVMSKSYSLPPF